MNESTGQGLSPVQKASPTLSSGTSGSSGPCPPPPRKKVGLVVAGATVSRPPAMAPQRGGPELFSLSGDSTPEEDEVSSNPSGRNLNQEEVAREFQRHGAHLVNPMAYDIVDDLSLIHI